jgi:hypothetical protein
MTGSEDQRSARLIYACFPRSWRTDGRADEALGIAWDGADDAGREDLGAKQALDLSWLGLRARVGAAAQFLPLATRRLVVGLALGGGVGLAVCLLFIAAVPPTTSPGAAPLASAGTALYLAWILSSLVAAAGSEALARLCLAGTAVLTAATALFAESAGIRRPALFLLAILFALSVLALGVRPLARQRAQERWAIVGSAIIAGFGIGALGRGATYFPSTSLYYGNALMLSTLAKVTLLAFAVAALLALGSLTGRRYYLPALVISAGPWAVLAACGSTAQGRAVYIHIATATVSWFFATTMVLTMNRPNKAAVPA